MQTSSIPGTPWGFAIFFSLGGLFPTMGHTEQVKGRIELCIVDEAFQGGEVTSDMTPKTGNYYLLLTTNRNWQKKV